jgi:magnesium transporter
MQAVENLVRRGKADPHRVLDAGVDMLLYNLLDEMVDHYSPILEHLQETFEDLEDQAVTDPRPDLLQRISEEKRQLLNLRRVIAPQRDVLAMLARGDVPFIRESTRVYLRDVLDHLARAVEMIELHRELVVSARDLYLTSINNNLNSIMKTLTVVTVVAAVLNVYTGFFGMNFEKMPGLKSHWTFWLTVSIMLTTATVLVIVFRRKKWL